jgi:hypothetical protein
MACFPKTVSSCRMARRKARAYLVYLIHYSGTTIPAVSGDKLMTVADLRHGLLSEDGVELSHGASEGQGRLPRL